MSPSPAMFGNVVVLGGAGAMGRTLCELLSACADRVVGIDRREAAREAGWRLLAADVLAPDGEARDALSAADLVVLALPEEAAIESLPVLAKLVPHRALLVDTLSVKKPFADRLAALALPFEALSINPMFAPSLGFEGQSVAAIRLKPGAATETFCRFIRGLGARVVEIGVDEHDRAMAALQTATHAAILGFGLALKRLDYRIDALAPLVPPPHRAMLALLARIVEGAPEVYWDIQVANPYAGEARAAVADGLDRLRSLADSADADGFRQMIGDLRLGLGAHRPALAELCARMFALPHGTGRAAAANRP